MKANPKVSVIIPTYNRAHLVTRAIHSILNQTFRDLEVIVVDDGSTDYTAEIITNIKDERVKYIRQVNKGASAARNTGIRATMGELIGFLDSDDEWLPEKLQKQVGKFNSSSLRVGLIYGACLLVDHSTKKTIGLRHPKKRGDVYLEMLNRNIPASPTPLVRRECFNEVGFFDEGFRVGEDWDMWVRIARCYEFDFVDEVVARYYISQYQMTKDLTEFIQGHLKFIEKHQIHLMNHPRIFAHHLRQLAQMYLLLNDRSTARKYFTQAIKMNPRSPNIYLQALASYCLPSLYLLTAKGKRYFEESYQRWQSRF